MDNRTKEKIVLFAMPTYGRLGMLDASVGMFLLQNKMEGFKFILSVVNTDPKVEVSCNADIPIVIHNHKGDERMSLIDARNTASLAVESDYIIPWDDDDLHFPTRAESHIEFLETQEKVNWVCHKDALVDNGFRKFQKVGYAIVHSGAFRTSEFHNAGHYGGGVDKQDDVNLWRRFKNKLSARVGGMPHTVYSTKRDSYHTSMSSERVRELSVELDRERAAPNGKFLIRPSTAVATMKYSNFWCGFKR